jgi:hypothetical protein
MALQCTYCGKKLKRTGIVTVLVCDKCMRDRLTMCVNNEENPAMQTQPISAPANRAVTVEVFEPSQHQDQPQEVIDRFNMYAGEVRDYPMRSATAGFRFLDLTDPKALDELEERRRERPSEPTPAQEPPGGVHLMPGTEDELGAGEARQQEHQEAEERRAREEVAGGVSTPSSGSLEAREAHMERATLGGATGTATGGGAGDRSPQSRQVQEEPKEGARQGAKEEPREGARGEQARGWPKEPKRTPKRAPEKPKQARKQSRKGK